MKKEFVATVLKNEVEYLSQLRAAWEIQGDDDSSFTRGMKDLYQKFVDHFGKDFESVFLSTIRTALEGSVLGEIVHCEAATHPIMVRSICRRTYEASEDGPPTISMAVEDLTLRMVTRRVRVALTDGLHHSAEEILSLVWEEVITGWERSVLQDLRIAAEAIGVRECDYTRYEAACAAVHGESHAINSRSMRSGANVIVTNVVIAADLPLERRPESYSSLSSKIQYAGRLDDEFKVFTDPLFPTGEMLLVRRSDDYSDPTYLAALYMVRFHEGLRAVTRSANYLVNPGSVGLVRLKLD